MNFTGKNILVAGGSSGIGLATVIMLAEAGASVYNLSRSASNEWPASVKHQNRDVLGDIGAMESFLPDTLHGLVYCVGSITLKPFSRLTETDFLTDYRLNVIGAAKIIQLAFRGLKNAQGASIVLMSTVAAKAGMSYHASIAAAKSGVEGLALSLAAEFASQQIRVNVIAPSLTDTPLAQNLLNTPEKREVSAKRHPLGKIGDADEIASAIVFLLSSSTSWMTGQVIGIDGGLGNLRPI